MNDLRLSRPYWSRTSSHARRNRRVAGLVLVTALMFLQVAPAGAVKFHPSQTPLLTFGPQGCAAGSGGASGFGDISGGLATGDTTILGVGTGDLVSGSTSVSNVAVANGTGTGEVVSGSTIVQHAVTATGTFVAGQSISGPGIPAGTQVQRVFGGNLTLTKKATSTSASTSLTANGGEFTVGEPITGEGIPPATTITAVAGGTLTLSNPVEAGKGGTGASLLSGSRTITNVVMAQGAFQVGNVLASGGGLPGGATVTAVTSTTVALSEGAAEAHVGVIFRAGSAEVTSLSVRCGDFEIGQELSRATSAPGSNVISTGTKITGVGSNALTLSEPLAGSGTGVLISAGPAFPQGSPINDVAIDEQRQRLYVLTYRGTAEPAEIFGFDISTPGTYPRPLPGFDPLVTPPLGGGPHIAVDNSGSGSSSDGNIYVSSGRSSTPPLASEIYGFTPSGAALSGFPVKLPDHEEEAGVIKIKEGGKEKGQAKAIAVDPKGVIWAINFAGHARLDRYSDSGALLSEADITEQAPGAVALDFDSAGDLFVAGGNTIWKYPAPANDVPVPFVQSSFAYNLTVDRSDGSVYAGGAGPKRITRYDADGGLLEEFGNLEKEGIAGTFSEIYGAYDGVAIDHGTGWAYVADSTWSHRVDVFDAVDLVPPRTGNASDPGATEVTLNGTVRPEGIPLTDCRFEYVTQAAFEATGFEDLSSGGELHCRPSAAEIPIDSNEHSVSALATGLDPSTVYRFRLLVATANGSVSGGTASFRLGAPDVETVGSPIRDAGSAQLNGRIYAHGLASRYHFEYGTAGPCDANPCAGTAGGEAAGEEWQLVSQRVSGLRPGTTYYYRLVADNGGPDGAVAGGGRTLTTRASNAPLSHGHYPGPPDSDRAWEQVNLPDTGGSPVAAALGVASDGEGALYRVLGGTPLSQRGTAYNDLYARRPAGAHPRSGWQSENIYPSRTQAPYSGWLPPTASDDLSSITALNINTGEAGSAAGVWQMRPGGSPRQAYALPAGQFGSDQNGHEKLYLAADDGSRALLAMNGSLDPAHPAPSGVPELYDVSSGTPRLVGLMTDGSVPACGVAIGPDATQFPSQAATLRENHWISADGSRVFFPSAGSEPGCGTAHLYMRDLITETTTRLDAPLSGPTCPGMFIRSTAAAAFFWTQSRLSAEDTAVPACQIGNGILGEGGDVYRYRFSDQSLACLTCGPWGAANVSISAGGEAGGSIAVASDGSRVYFKSATPLVEGAPPAGTSGLYRLDPETGQLAYVAAIGEGEVGDSPLDAEGISADGSVITFRSSASGLNALGGQQNGGTAQYYVYDDGDRSLSCASCPTDGSAPSAPVPVKGLNTISGGLTGAGPNQTALSADGNTFAFSTPTALVSADQNTAGRGEPSAAGTDVYEWREGRVLLVSDGLTSWPELAEPVVAAVTPSGRDLFFIEAAQLTPDALDSYKRLYDARIGGGIDYPETAPPCPLDACQGVPKGAPAELIPGSSHFSGAGNVEEGRHRKRCPKKGKRKARRHGKVRCVKPHRHAKRGHHRRSRTGKQHHRPNFDRKAAR